MLTLVRVFCTHIHENSDNQRDKDAETYIKTIFLRLNYLRIAERVINQKTVVQAQVNNIKLFGTVLIL